MFLNAHTSAKIYLEMCERFTALAFTCNHFFTRLFKQDKLVLKDLRFHVRLHVCQRVIRLTATSLFTLKVSVYLFSLPTFVPLPSFLSFLFLSFPLSLLDCPPVFFLYSSVSVPFFLTFPYQLLSDYPAVCLCLLWFLHQSSALKSLVLRPACLHLCLFENSNFAIK